MRGMLGLLMLGVAAAACPPAAAGGIARGDAAWAARADGERSGRPRAGPIREAVDAYGEELAARPGGLEARWKLLRALHFAGAFVAVDAQQAVGYFDRARRVSEEGLDRLARAAGEGERLDALDPRVAASRLEASALPVRDVARLHFWAAINWGAWSRSVGLLEAVRRGVANRLFRYTRLSLALEPDYDDGGALRLLGRLHAELPRVPFISGWVDRSRALPLVERAYALAPANPGNRLLLALTLLDLAPDRRREARRLLRQVAELEPRASMRIEDLTMRREARERLEGGVT